MDQSAILEDYKTLRSTGRILNNALMALLKKEDLQTAARRLGLFRHNKMVFDSEEEMHVLMDYAIHDIFHDGLNSVDRFLRDTPPAEGSAEARLLRSLQYSRYTIFEVGSRIPGFGVEGFAGAERTPTTLVDIGFSQTARPGVSFATRLHSPNGEWHMTTGTALPLTPDALDRLHETFTDYQERHGHQPPDRERTMILIRECLRAGVSQNIRYAEPSETVHELDAPPVAPIRRGIAKVGRNDPCPCGSGKKYKKCCGV